MPKDLEVINYLSAKEYNRLRVLHVLPRRDLAYGGPVVVAEAYARIIEPYGGESKIFPSSQIPHGRFSRYPNLRALQQLRRVITEVDLVHIHGLWFIAGAFAARVARQMGIPYLITAHGMLDRWSLRQSWFKKWLYIWLIERRNLKYAAAIHLLNQQEYEASEEMLIDLPTFILPNGIDIASFSPLPDRSELRARYPELAGKSVVLFLGRINYKKGLDLLVSAFRSARRSNPSLHLVIAGPNDGYLDKLKSLIKQEDIAEHVSLIGIVTGRQKMQMLAGADIFALFSRQEGDSVALKEAMAAGLPAIITDACNFPEAEKAQAAIVITFDTQAAAKAISDLSNSVPLQLEMGRNARNLIFAKYGWDAIAEKLMGHYRAIVGGNERHWFERSRQS